MVVCNFYQRGACKFGGKFISHHTHIVASHTKQILVRMSILEVHETVAEAVLAEVPIITASTPSTATAIAQVKTVDLTDLEVCLHFFNIEEIPAP